MTCPSVLSVSVLIEIFFHFVCHPLHLPVSAVALTHQGGSDSIPRSGIPRRDRRRDERVERVTVRHLGNTAGVEPRAPVEIAHPTAELFGAAHLREEVRDDGVLGRRVQVLRRHRPEKTIQVRPLRVAGRKQA